jgi:hypothetical protein
LGTGRVLAQGRINRANNGVMFEIFRNFGGRASRLSPLVLTGLVAAAATIGLLVRLGGLAFIDDQGEV